MSDLLKGLAGGGWPFLVAWVLPSSLAVAVFTIAILPAIDHLPIARQLAGLDTTQGLLVAAFGAVAVAVVMSQVQVLLYRVLEGYVLWPESLRDRRTKAWIEKLRIRSAAAEAAEPGVDRQLQLEAVHQFPPDPEQMAPTRFGNAIRAFEVYGYDRYNLDSQALWSELIACVPEPLPDEYERARAGVDFFVSMLWISAAVGIGALFTGIWSSENRSTALLVGFLTIVLIPVWWYLAVKSVDYWHSVVQAIVNLGRKPLAESLGLRLPAKIGEERRMWRLVSWCVYYPYREDLAVELEAFRQTGEQPDDLPLHE